MKLATLTFVLCALCGSAVYAQQRPEGESRPAGDQPPVLSELEQLALSNLLKDFTIAQLQRQVAQRNEDAARGAFSGPRSTACARRRKRPRRSSPSTCRP